MRLVSAGFGKPRRSFGESGVVAAVLLHGSAFPVPALFFWPTCTPNRILPLFFACWRRGFHSNFFSVIHDRSSAQLEIKRRHELRNLVVMLAIAVSIIGTHNIVVADHKRWPAGCLVDSGNLLAEFRWQQLVHHSEKKI